MKMIALRTMMSGKSLSLCCCRTLENRQQTKAGWKMKIEKEMKEPTQVERDRIKSAPLDGTGVES